MHMTAAPLGMGWAAAAAAGGNGGGGRWGGHLRGVACPARPNTSSLQPLRRTEPELAPAQCACRLGPDFK